MKGNYSKPILTIELFNAAQSTTRDCADFLLESQMNFNDPDRCGWDTGSAIFFIEGGKACNENGEGMQGVCYNNPAEGSYIFRS